MLSDDFASVVYKLRSHTLCNYGMLADDGARHVMIDMVITNLRLWVNDIMLAPQQSSPMVVPSPSSTVFDTPPLPAFDRALAFCRGGGDVLKSSSARRTARATGLPSARPITTRPVVRR